VSTLLAPRRCRPNTADQQRSCDLDGPRQLHPLVWPPLRTPKELLGRKADVLGDLAQQRRGDVPSRVKWHGRSPTVSVPILLVGTPLPNLREAEALEKGNYFPRLEGGQAAHYATLMVCTPTNSDSSLGSPSSRSMLTTS